MNERRFHGSLNDIRADASHYSSEEAISLYVEHPEGLPTSERNSLVVGPLGSGKTIMLKALVSVWSSNVRVKPVYVDAHRWTAQISAEADTYSGDVLSPRATNLLQAMSLAVSVGLCESVGAFAAPADFSSVWNRFEDAFQTRDAAQIRSEARRCISNALVRNSDIPAYLPSVYTVACALGADIQAKSGQLLILLVDQIDQVPPTFFTPVAELLRRSGEFLSVLATRPCPTAPEPEILPSGITAGDDYRIIQIGRVSHDASIQSFIRAFVDVLPLAEPFRSELFERSELIAVIMWPALRTAINTIHDYVRRRESDVEPDEAWYLSLKSVATSYEDIVQDGLRAWCANPRSMIADWRNEILTRSGQQQLPLGRALLDLPKGDLFDVVGDRSAQRLIRIALKRGVLFISPTEHYVPGSIPSSCEIAPLLLVNDARFVLDRFDAQPRVAKLSEDLLRRWTSRFGQSQRLLKKVFVSFWMSNPRMRGESALANAVRSKFASSVEVVLGELTGSPRWSPEIMSKIDGVNLVLCDLTTPRRDVLVEYGVAIGKHVPVIQCFEAKTISHSLPAWIANRQYQFFASSPADTERFLTSVSEFLDSEPDPQSAWRRDSIGKLMDLSPHPERVIFIGPRMPRNWGEQMTTVVEEAGFEFRSLIVAEALDNLEEVIKATRLAALAVFAFDGTRSDYLTCVAGGVFATRSQGTVPSTKRKYNREMILINMSTAPNKQVVPALLTSHPRATTVRPGAVREALQVRLETLRAALSKTNNKKTRS